MGRLLLKAKPVKLLLLQRLTSTQPPSLKSEEMKRAGSKRTFPPISRSTVWTVSSGVFAAPSLALCVWCFLSLRQFCSEDTWRAVWVKPWSERTSLLPWTWPLPRPLPQKKRSPKARRVWLQTLQKVKAIIIQVFAFDCNLLLTYFHLTFQWLCWTVRCQWALQLQQLSGHLWQTSPCPLRPWVLSRSLASVRTAAPSSMCHSLSQVYRPYLLQWVGSWKLLRFAFGTSLLIWYFIKLI